MSIAKSGTYPVLGWKRETLTQEHGLRGRPAGEFGNGTVLVGIAVGIPTKTFPLDNL